MAPKVPQFFFLLMQVIPAEADPSPNCLQSHPTAKHFLNALFTANISQ